MDESGLTSSPENGPESRTTSSPETRAGTGCWVVINYDILGRHIDALLAHDWAGIVFDEAHYVKNHRSQRSRLGRRLVEREGHDPAIVALTGTPLTNRPRDLFAQLQLASLTKARQRIAAAKTAHTIEFVEGAVAQDEKVIVFTGFDEPARRIHAHFGDTAMLLTGATPAHRRQSLVDRFQDEDDVRVVRRQPHRGRHRPRPDRGEAGRVQRPREFQTLDGFVARALAVKSGLIRPSSKATPRLPAMCCASWNRWWPSCRPISRTGMSKATTRSSACCAR